MILLVVGLSGCSKEEEVNLNLDDIQSFEVDYTVTIVYEDDYDEIFTFEGEKINYPGEFGEDREFSIEMFTREDDEALYRFPYLLIEEKQLTKQEDGIYTFDLEDFNDSCGNMEFIKDEAICNGSIDWIESFEVVLEFEEGSLVRFSFEGYSDSSGEESFKTEGTIEYN